MGGGSEDPLGGGGGKRGKGRKGDGRGDKGGGDGASAGGAGQGRGSGGGGGGGRQRWAPKDGAPAAQPPVEERIDVAAASAPEVRIGQATEDAGPSYSREALLGLFTSQRATLPRDTEAKPEAVTAVSTLLSERPETPIMPSRRALMEARKEQKIKRLGSGVGGSKLDPNAEAFVPVGAPATTPGGGKRISLSDAMPSEDSMAAAASADSGMQMGGMLGGTLAGFGPDMLSYMYSMSMDQFMERHMQQATEQRLRQYLEQYLKVDTGAASTLSSSDRRKWMLEAAAAAQGCTTVMLRNIPNRYTRDMLLERLNQGYKAQYDFVYLPIDFNSKCNVGYAFINFRTSAAARGFMQEFHLKKAQQCLPGFSSQKVCEVSFATVQGREANMENFRDEQFIEKLKERPEWHPLFLDDNGKEIPLSKVLSGVGKKRRGASGTAPSPMAVPPAPPVTPYAAMMSPSVGAFSPFGMGVMPTPFGMLPTGPFASPVVPAATASTPTAPSRTALLNVLPNATSATMLMLKNIPNALTRAQLIKAFNDRYKGAYDFLYVPGDFQSAGAQKSRGFLFINFRSAKRAQQFTKDFDQKRVSECFGVVMPEGEENKACEVLPAKLTNLSKAIERLQSPAQEAKVVGTSPVSGGGSPIEKATEKAAWYPLLFAPDGDPLPFPLLTSPVRIPSTLPS